MTVRASDLDDNRPRRPVVAALLSLALPGLGQFYNGELNKALWAYLGFVLVGVAGVTASAISVPTFAMLPCLAASVAATLVVWLGAVVDAWRVAAGRQIYTRSDWQVSGVYALILVAGQATIYSLIMDSIRPHRVQAFSIPSSSMEPGILKGDYLFADKRYNCPECKGRVTVGDIGIFVYPNDRTTYYIKRVIGLPGDRIAIRGHEVTVNGRSLTKEAVVQGDQDVVTEQSGTRTWRVTWTQNTTIPNVDLTVPQGQVFLLGDNRGSSLDSRSFGGVPLADLVGRARQIWFSTGDSGIRWDRLGQVVE